MHRQCHVILAIMLIFLLPACGSNEKQVDTAKRLTPLPAKKQVISDPSNGLFMDAIAQYVTAEGGPNNTRYEFTRIDLNNDGRREGLVMMKTPHKFWCEDYGCRMAVFEAHNDGFRLISEIQPARGPLVVLEENDHGWKQIMARVSGRSGWAAKDVVLKFDGRSYPAQPAFQPSMKYSFNDERGVKIFP